MNTDKNNIQLPQSSVSDSLSMEDKRKYLREVVYENVKHSQTGKLLINTFYCRKVAEFLGMKYDSLTKVQKDILKADIVTESIVLEEGSTRYLRF